MKSKQGNELAVEALCAWLDADQVNPNRLEGWVAKILMEHHDMPAAWQALDPLNSEGVMHVFSLVCSALRAASKEVQRPTHSEERTAIQKVIRLAGQLKEAIEHSPLPRDWGKLAQLDSKEVSEHWGAAHLVIGWRDVRQDGYGLGHPLEIVKVLDLAVELAQEYIQQLPPRAAIRHKKRPEIATFVRWLAWTFAHKLGSEHRDEVALIATAIYDAEGREPLTRRSVDSILKDTPSVFKQPPKVKSINAKRSKK